MGPTNAGQRRRDVRRRGWTRALAPLLFVAVTLAGTILVVVRDHRAHRETVVGLSKDVLRSLDRQVVAELRAFLGSASSMADFLARVANDSGPTRRDDKDRLDEVASDLLRTHRPLVMVNIADTTGQFLMPKEMPDGSIDTKHIDVVDGERTVRWVRRAPDGNVERVETVPWEGYDPRGRPWYEGAVRTGGLYWTDVYVFFTDKKPGVTAAAPVYDRQGELMGVLGLDIELADLSAFLARLEVGRTGIAVIVGEEGELIAHPDVGRTFKQVGDEVQPARITELDDPTLQRAYDQFRLEGPGQRTFEIDGDAFISLASTLPEDLGRRWTVLLVAPESDFLGAVAADTRRSLVLGLAVVGLGLLVGLVVIVQTVRAERRARAALDRRDRLDGCVAGLVEAACDAAGAGRGGADETDQDWMLERMARIVGTPRVSVWSVDTELGRVVLDVVHDGGATRPGGVAVPVEGARAFADLAAAAEPIPVADAAAHPATAALIEPYLRGADAGAVLVAPLGGTGGLPRMLVFEHAGGPRDWNDDEIRCAAVAAEVYVANLFAPGDEKTAEAEVAPAEVARGSARETDARREAVRRALTDSADSADSAAGADRARAARTLEDAAVVVAVVHAGGPDAEAEPVRAERTARFFRAAAESYECAAAQWQGDRFVAVIAADGARPAPRALALARCLAGDFGRCVGAGDAEARIGIGIDAGPVVVWADVDGAASGTAAGTVVRRASALARCARGTEVQVTAAVRRALDGRHATRRRSAYLTAELEEVEIYGVDLETA